MQTTHPKQSLGRDLRDAPGFSLWALLLAVLGSVIGATLTNACGSGTWGVLAGAVLGPVVSTTFSTKRTGEKGRVRNATILILSAGALLITFTGFTFADGMTGKSVISQRASTFPWEPVSSSTSVKEGPDIKVEPDELLDFGTVESSTGTPDPQTVTITSAGTGVLRITSVEVTGPHSSDFTASQDCVGKSLSPGQTCELEVSFNPTADGARQATLVIHQNIPWPDQGTRITLKGTSGIPNGTPPTVTPTAPTETLKTAVSSSYECSAVPYYVAIPGVGSFSVTDGILPPGLELDSATGIISGIATTNGTYRFDITVTDSSGVPTIVRPYILPVFGCIK